MKIIFVGRGKEVEIKGPKNVQSIAKELGISLEANVFIKDGEIIAPDDVIDDDATVEVISAVSGG